MTPPVPRVARLGLARRPRARRRPRRARPARARVGRCATGRRWRRARSAAPRRRSPPCTGLFILLLGAKVGEEVAPAAGAAGRRRRAARRVPGRPVRAGPRDARARRRSCSPRSASSSCCSPSASRCARTTCSASAGRRSSPRSSAWSCRSSPAFALGLGARRTTRSRRSSSASRSPPRASASRAGSCATWACSTGGWREGRHRRGAGRRHPRARARSASRRAPPRATCSASTILVGVAGIGLVLLGFAAARRARGLPKTRVHLAAVRRHAARARVPDDARGRAARRGDRARGDHRRVRRRPHRGRDGGRRRGRARLQAARLDLHPVLLRGDRCAARPRARCSIPTIAVLVDHARRIVGVVTKALGGLLGARVEGRWASLDDRLRDGAAGRGRHRRREPRPRRAGVVDAELFAVMLVAVILTTVIAPYLLAVVRAEVRARAAERPRPRPEAAFSGGGRGLAALLGRGRRRAPPVRAQEPVDLGLVRPPDRHPVEPFEVLEVGARDLAQRPAGVAPEGEQRARTGCRAAARPPRRPAPIPSCPGRSRCPFCERPVVQFGDTYCGARPEVAVARVRHPGEPPGGRDAACGLAAPCADPATAGPAVVGPRRAPARADAARARPSSAATRAAAPAFACARDRPPRDGSGP